MGFDQGTDCGIGEVVGMDDQKGFIPKPASIGQQRASGPVKFGFMDEVNLIAPRRVSDKGFNLLGQMMGIDQYALNLPNRKERV